MLTVSILMLDTLQSWHPMSGVNKFVQHLCPRRRNKLKLGFITVKYITFIDQWRLCQPLKVYHTPPRQNAVEVVSLTTKKAYINIQSCISQTQQNFIMFIIVLGQRVSILIESSLGPSKNTDPYLPMLLSKDLYS